MFARAKSHARNLGVENDSRKRESSSATETGNRVSFVASLVHLDASRDMIVTNRREHLTRSKKGRN